MQNFLEASRVELAPKGVAVTIVNPGWVRTPIIEKYKGGTPFVVPVDKAARIIANGLERRARTIEFPLPMALVMRLARILPAAIYDRAMRPYSRRKIDPDKVKR
jgi:short-subunit dehydrogenase